MGDLGAHEWVFDPVPPSGAIKGGIPVSYVFEGDLNTFVREVLQNSHDQKVESGARAEVVFELMELEGTELREFLDAMRWEALRGHLSGVVQRGVLNARTISEAIAALEAEGALRVLKVSDYGTFGLTGGEDESGTNYKALVKDVLETTEGGAKKGGSHGLGKAVLWAFSSISTVLFSSWLEDGGASRFRLVGRADLPYHDTGEGSWDGAGWLGKREGQRAVSMWDDDAIEVARPLRLSRGAGSGTGTSLLIPAFREPRLEEQRPIADLARSIVDAAIDNFWPAIQRGTLSVKATVRDADGSVHEYEATQWDRVLPFIEATTADDPSERATDEGHVAARDLEIRFPARIEDPTGDARVAKAKLLLRRAGEGADDEHVTRVALIRGAGMVVEYWKPKRLPLSGGGFHAVLLAGLARGKEEEDGELEAFLRACEPPAHNKWDGRTNRIHNEYHRGALRAVNDLWDRITESVIDMCEMPAPDQADGPAMLKKLFPLGRGGPPQQTFRMNLEGGEFDGTNWVINGRIQRLGSKEPWETSVLAVLDGESGRGVPLTIIDSQLAPGSDASAEMVGGHLKITVPRADDVRFTLRAAGGEMPVDLLRRSRARLTARSRVVKDLVE